MTEGNAGTTVLDVNVELQIGSVPLARDVAVTVSTEDGTATGRLAQWGKGIVVVTEEMTGTVLHMCMVYLHMPDKNTTTVVVTNTITSQQLVLTMELCQLISHSFLDLLMET